MEYIFLVVAAAWALQFLLAYYQLQRFHRQIAQLRKLGRCAVGLYGNRWRGRTYGVVVVDAHDRIRHAGVFTGWTVFSKLKPVTGLDGMPLDTILASERPLIQLSSSQWAALRHAAQFFKTNSTPTQLSKSSA
jgi:DNA-binding transcriptional regulator of glucitol operon